MYFNFLQTTKGGLQKVPSRMRHLKVPKTTLQFSDRRFQRRPEKQQSDNVRLKTHLIGIAIFCKPPLVICRKYQVV
jgi:hypothetical protein